MHSYLPHKKWQNLVKLDELPAIRTLYNSNEFSVPLRVRIIESLLYLYSKQQMAVWVQVQILYSWSKNERPFEYNFENFIFCIQRANDRRTNGRLGIVFKILYFTLKKYTGRLGTVYHEIPLKILEFVLNAIEKVKPGFLLSLMCIFSESNRTKS